MAYIMYKVNYNGRTLYVSSCFTIVFDWMDLFDAEFNLLAIA